MRSRRLFYALWPDDDVRHTLAAWQRQHLPKGARATHLRDLHMTLHFLGQVETPRVKALEELGNRLVLPEFDLILDNIGHWSRPAVLWLGPQETPAKLLAFHQQLEEALESLGLERDKRTYRPHVTLARKVRRALQESDFPPLRWIVREWALLESRPGERPLYHPLMRWPAKKIANQG